MNSGPSRQMRYMALLVLLSYLDSCQRNVPVAPAPVGDTTVNIYVLGNSGDTAVYWKNGSSVFLAYNAEAPNSPYTYTSSMAVSGSDVYISGGNLNGFVSTANYWKNGVGFTLPDTTGNAETDGIAVAGSDVYVAGKITYRQAQPAPNSIPSADTPQSGAVATLWKNSVPVTLTGLGLHEVPQGYGRIDHDDYVSGIYLSGTDIYVSGGSNVSEPNTPSTYQFAGYWKNGVYNNLIGIVQLTSTNGPIFPSTSCIAVNNNNVYIGGNHMTGGYWENGDTISLVTPPAQGSVLSIFANGNDLYFAGLYESPASGGIHAAYWKNGVPVILDHTNNYSVANYIYVLGNDVYVAGLQVVGGIRYATYWKNGVATHLGKGADNSSATSIIVVPK